MSDHKNVTKTLNHLLNAPYPFKNQSYKKLYEKSDKIPNLYHCNICHLKLLGDKQLSDHNGCFQHQMVMEKLISEMWTTNKEVPIIRVSEPSRMAKKMLRASAINVSKMKLNEEWTKLKHEYDQYAQNPSTHPMYAKEWAIFYYRTLSDIIAVNDDPNTFDFGKHWQTYWKQRIQVYHYKSQRNIIDEIASNYQSTVFHEDHSDPSSNDETSKISRSTSRSTSSMSSYIDIDAFNLTGRMSTDVVPNVPEKNLTLSDMDISIGSKNEDDDNAKDNIVVVSCNPAPQLRKPSKPKARSECAERAKDDIESTIPRTLSNSFVQHAIDVAAMQLTLQYLEKCNLSVENLSDDQLKTYIEYVIDTNYYERNLRSGSVESHVSIDSSHSR